MSNKCVRCKAKIPDHDWYENSSHLEFYSRYLGYCGKKCYYEDPPNKRHEKEWGVILQKIWKKLDEKPKSLRELGKSLNLKRGLLEKI